MTGKNLSLSVITTLVMMKWRARVNWKTCRIATLADQFGLTSFHAYQKDVIDNCLGGRDTVVIQPTGSGKSLCYQFPAVYTGKLSIIISPMVDEVEKLKRKGISAAYLGSAQHDKTLEPKIFNGERDVRVLFIIPEWLYSSNKMTLLKQLVEKKKIVLIAVDEAHLVFEWQTFREKYRNVEMLKQEFPNVPFMFLTATATPEIEAKLLSLFTHPFISKSTVNRTNVKYSVEKLPPKGRPTQLNRGDYTIFAQRVADIVGNESTIVYTDFVADVGPILCALRECGLSCVGYYGEMDPMDRKESYDQWMTGNIQLMVATKAFGLGIDKCDIRHVIRTSI